ncbi:MAG: phenylalanyl-tRNA synthetase beta chain [Candidatus Dependentiae bacterium]|nr:phenylalanyl-tRNA synthetase beta chain [Candidatus Dependentiae bacterium]
MKISLRWLCDHIVGLPWQAVSVDQLMARFNAKVAEIEHVEHLLVPIASFEAVRIVAADAQKITVQFPSGATASLPFRSDVAQCHDPLAAYLVTTDGSEYRWAALNAVGLDKDGLIPALHITQADLAGGWRSQWEAEDIILDVDNKSLTHRPDMWGHRGFAREVAALFDTRLVDATQFCEEISVVQSHPSVVVRNEVPAACSGVGGIRVDHIVQMACDLRATSRLINIGYRPRSAVIDMTNYAMADWGHPMHAYDAERMRGHTITVRFAQIGEKLLLLDDSSINLDAQDLVVADAEKIVGLAGIMGGKNDSVLSATTSLIFEAACFHASTIRRSATRHKLRSESSQRFEKTLDPMQIVSVLERCVSLARTWGVVRSAITNPIVLLAPPRPALIVPVSHRYIVNRIGAELTPSNIVDLLTSIDIPTTYTTLSDDTVYSVQVPSYRATKDISGPHDIVEEVARLYGFNNIVPSMPAVLQRASNLQPVMRERAIKNYLAYGAQMQEQRNYAFYNQQLLTQLGWEEPERLILRNPVSQDASALVSSLIPHLLGNVMDNMADVDRCAFFEWGTVWPAGNGSERKELAGVWYDKRGSFDFYQLKQAVTEICRLAGIKISWRVAPLMPEFQWLGRSPAALVLHEGVVIGVLGGINPVMIQKMGGLPESTVYGFVLNGSLLQNHPAPRYTVGQIRKYQHSTVDVSALVLKTSHVADLEGQLRSCSELIEEVSLIDFFEKKEWTDRRSVAFRLTLSHSERTLTREEVEQIRVKALEVLAANGGQLRE